MPFRSEAQRRFLWAEHPDIARRWSKRYGSDVKAKPKHPIHHSKAHPGFAALVKRGVPAGALANNARHASKAAVKRNPRLLRVPR